MDLEKIGDLFTDIESDAAECANQCALAEGNGEPTPELIGFLKLHLQSIQSACAELQTHL